MARKGNIENQDKRKSNQWAFRKKGMW